MSKEVRKDEKQVLDFIFKENSDLELNEQEKNINTYFAIKHHIPNEVFKTGKLNFSYNKGVSYILACYEDIQIFKIPNCKNKLIEIACPPSKDFINSLDVAEIQKEATLKRYKDTKATVWYIKLTPEEVLYYSSSNWIGFTNLILSIAKL